MKKTMLATGLAGALLFTSACAADNSSSDSAGASTEKVVIDGVEYGPTIEGMPTLPELASDSKGKWRKTTILPDDPAFSYEDSVVDPSATGMWSDEEIKEAHKLAVEMAVDTIDTSANGAPGDTEAKLNWWKANEDKFHPFWKQEMYNAVIDDDPNMPLIFKGKHRIHADEKLDYGLVYGENEVHVKDRKISTTKIMAGELPEGKALEVTLKVDHTNVAEVDGKKADEKSEGTLVYTLMKDTKSEKILVAGFNAEYKFQILR
ncbi:MAG: hypothetical protein H9W81_07370 [Enterococcus sp.]|nr:hypothetical protein [Enterococcus sp.]